MAGICDRCNERSSQLINIGIIPELKSIMHLGYRHVCADCYDDLVAEAKSGGGEGRDPEEMIPVSIEALVTGNTSHLEPFQDKITIEEVGHNGLTFSTGRDLDPGAVLDVSVQSYGLEFTAIVEETWEEDDHDVVALKLVEASEGWERLWRDYSSDGGQ